jgi:hypothetical protein
MDMGMMVHVVIAFIFAIGFAYLIYATAAKAEGTLQSVGNVLAIAIAAIAALFLVGMLTAPMTGGRPFGLDMHHEGAAPASGDENTGAPAGGETGGKPGADQPHPAPTGKP